MLKDKRTVEYSAGRSGLGHQKPRKRAKNQITDNKEDYNQFHCLLDYQVNHNIQPDVPISQTINNTNNDCNITAEKNSYSKIFQQIKKNPYDFRKLKSEPSSKNAQNQKNKTVAVKKQEKEDKLVQIKEEIIQNKNQSKGQDQKKSKNKIKKVPNTGNSNWQSFIKQHKEEANKPKKNNNNSNINKQENQFVAIDCQFVKSNEKECLARISLVDENCNTLYDSFIKPQEKITDYLSQISGVTYKHIKNAPNQSTVINQAKKYMLNKIIIGHTLYKDLQVCQLSKWAGFKAKIDISEAKCYVEKQGKRVSLKNMAHRFLGLNIQKGTHSSVQDAYATVKLFNKNKINILKQYKLIK